MYDLKMNYMTRKTIYLCIIILLALASQSYASSKYDLQTIVGQQVLTSNLLLRGMFLDHFEMKLNSNNELEFQFDIEKRKLPFNYPMDNFAFDIYLDDKPIGRTSNWIEWDVDDIKGVRVSHVFSDAELDVLFTLAPLSGKELKLSNESITLIGDLKKQ